jgi:hypothetical protein
MKNKKTFWERKTWLGWGVLLILLLATLFPALGLAQTGPDTMNFQGRLLDSSGNPLDGVTRCLRFRLCSDANCSNQRWPGSGYEYHAVTTGSGTHKAGYFSVALGDSPIPPTLLYDYDTLYLEIGVSDSSSSCSSASYITMTPRSQLGVNAYAQRSRRVRTEESDNASLVSVINTGSGGAIRAETQSTSQNAQAGFFRANATYGETYGVYAENDSTGDDAAAGYFYADGASGRTYGVYAENDSTSNSATAGYFLAGGNSGQTYGVWAENDSTSNSATAGYFLADGNSGQTYGVWAENDSTDTGATAGYFLADGNSGQTYGVWARNNSTDTGATAGYFRATGTSGATRGVSATNDSTDTGARAGQFFANGDSGQTYGVWARNDSTSNDAMAGYFHANGNSGQTYGVYAENDSTGTGATAGYFRANGNSGQTRGVYAENDSTIAGATAGFFLANGTRGSTSGVIARNNSSGASAAAGQFFAAATSGRTSGVRVLNHSTTEEGAYAIHAYKTSCTSGSWCYGVYTPNKMYAAAFDTTAGDVAEYLPTDQSLEPGDVVMADPRGGGRLARAEGAYNTAVLGLISTQPGLALGSGEHEGGDNNEGKAPLALSGRAPCKVSAENGPIRPGDLLTTSSTPGHAMRCEGMEQCFGRTIGKALDSLDSGTGVIEILVTLQ